MKYGIYSIRDEAAGIFTAPTIDMSDESAIRNFKKMCSDAGSMMNFKPSDFSLYYVGYYDSETAEINPLVPPNRLIVGSDCDYRKEIVHED